MDRTSVKVLKYINKQDDPVSDDQVMEKYGSKGQQSLSMLYQEGYLSRGIGQTIYYCDAATGKSETKTKLNNLYSIEPPGRDFLEHKFWNDFDRWVTRGAAIVGFVTGMISLIMHLIGYNAG